MCNVFCTVYQNNQKPTHPLLGGGITGAKIFQSKEVAARSVKRTLRVSSEGLVYVVTVMSDESARHGC